MIVNQQAISIGEAELVYTDRGRSTHGCSVVNATLWQLGLTELLGAPRADKPAG